MRRNKKSAEGRPPTETTLAEHWNTYATEVLPDNLPDVLRRELRRAFYGGAICTLLLSEQSSATKTVAALAVLDREMREFSERLMTEEV